jgi:hypothetical protein
MTEKFGAKKKKQYLCGAKVGGDVSHVAIRHIVAT